MFGYSNEALKQTAVKKKKKRQKITIIALCVAIICVSAGSGLFYLKVYSKPYGKYSLKKYVDLGEYKGLKKDPVNVDISKNKIKDQIDKDIEETANVKEIKKGVVNNGDTINIDYEATIDGDDFNGSKGKNVVLTIGSGSFVDGFESGLIGKKVGEETTLDITFPEDYSDTEIAGKKAEYKITVNSKNSVDIPKYTNEWVRKNTKYSSKEEYENAIKKKLEKKEKREAEIQQKDNLMNEVYDTSKILKIPEEEVERVKNDTVNMYKIHAKHFNMGYEEFLKKQLQMSKKEFDKQAEKDAKNQVKKDLVIFSIAKKEKIKVTEEEFDKYVSKLLEEYGYSESSFKKEYGKTYVECAGEDTIYSAIYEDKVKEFIFENSK